MTDRKKINLKIMTNKQCEEFISHLDTTGFTNYFDTREKRIKLIYAFRYMNETYIKFKNDISELKMRNQKVGIVKSFLNSIKIDIPKKSSGISEEDWSYIRTNWFPKLKEEKESKEMSRNKQKTGKVVVLNKEEIKEQLEEISNKTTEIISEVSLPREEIERNIIVEAPKQKRVNRRSAWKRRLVHDLMTDQILTFEEYCLSKKLLVRQGNAWHINHEQEVEFKGQKLNARWVEEESQGLQKDNKEL